VGITTVIVEEAGEVLEVQVLASLMPSVRPKQLHIAPFCVLVAQRF